MPETAPSKKYERPFTLRGDDAFFQAVKELQKLNEGALDMPTKSNVIRLAVMNELDRKRRERRK